jgi:hypothetical protein
MKIQEVSTKFHHSGELIDWEISPVLEGRMQATDKPGKINRRKKRLGHQRNSKNNDVLE